MFSLRKAPCFNGVVPAIVNTAAAFPSRHLVATRHVTPWPRSPKGPEYSVAEIFQLLQASGKGLSSRKEPFPKLPQLAYAASTQVSTNLKFSINCCVMGNHNVTRWEPSFLANIFGRNNCILLTVANSLPPNSSLVLPCRRAIWEFVFIFQVVVA